MKITTMLLLLFIWNIDAKVRILTFHFNKPEFIELQYKTYKKFLKDDFEIIVFNDANTSENEEAIKNTCERYEIKCVRFEPEWHFTDPLNEYLSSRLIETPFVSSYLGSVTGSSLPYAASIRHCHVIQYALDNYGFTHDDVVAIVDGDLFPIRPVSIRELLSGKMLVGSQKLTEENIDYLWVVFIAFDPRTLPDPHQFKCHADLIDNVFHDSGAHTYYYLKDHPDVKVEKLPCYHSRVFSRWGHKRFIKFGFNQDEIWLIRSLRKPNGVEFHVNQHFLHFGAGSFNYEGRDLKEECVKKYLNMILEN